MRSLAVIVHALCLVMLLVSPPTAGALVTPEEINTVRVYKDLAQVTVLISSAYTSSHHLARGTGKGIGSGVLIDSRGSIVTNAHVVDGAAKLMVTLHDGTRWPATVVGSDAQTDVALLRITLPPGKYPHAHLGDSNTLTVGQKVMALGHPFGLGYVMSTGIISGFGSHVEPHPDVLEDRIIQTTAPINPGNSGGPLVDSDNRVIGLNTSILLGAQNIGFATPINTVKSILSALEQQGRVIRPWLGIKGKFVTDELRALFALPIVDGLMVQDVAEGSPAQRIGLQAGALDVVVEGEEWVLGGDIITAIDGHAVTTMEQYTSVLRALRAEQVVELEVFRNHVRRKDTVTLGERPRTETAGPSRPTTDTPQIVPQALYLPAF